MVDITHKSSTLRKAIATALLTVSSPQTIEAVRERRVPKGDVFEFGRAAGLLGIKKTSDLIPDCHPLPVEFAAITYEIMDLSILIKVEVHTIYKTGVEVEAMHGASITALTIYDMLKPIDKGVFISNIKLEQKTGGKTDMKYGHAAGIPTHIVVCSDSISQGIGEDKAGKAAAEKLEKYGLVIKSYEIIADDQNEIKEKALLYGQNSEPSLVLFIGGTGLSPRDVTPDAIKPLLDREIPGIMETARNYGQQRMPYAMLSRGIAGFIQKALVITTPGSVKGAIETIDALFPQLLHVFKIAEGNKH
ncbi:MAG: bifunctional molybdenum cofactor biosynthesis protein MoaC/MoaB [Saprospiraceae bacterium]|nr:bifunctional molybdenum cofactor biosynthesis protein MoaC/MoaB [Saprospiraceae bacterium]